MNLPMGFHGHTFKLEQHKISTLNDSWQEPDLPNAAVETQRM